MNLQEIQTNFQDIILDAECTDADWVSKSKQGLSSKDRLTIYHNAYRLRLIDVLYDTFEHTAAYLGDDWFEQLASAYIQSHHSTHNNIGLYGEEYPEFLGKKLPNDKEVAELALLDWKLRRAFDGADSNVMTHDHLELIAGNEEQIYSLQPVPTLDISTHHFNTLDIWHAINHDEAPPVVKSLENPVDVLIWRKGHSPHFRTLTTMESAAITFVCSGHTLNDIGIELEKMFPDVDVVTEFGHMLRCWIDDKLLTFTE